MNRTAARIALAASALVLSGAATAPAAMASSAYPPVTPPVTTPVVPAPPAPAAAAPAPAAPEAVVRTVTDAVSVDALAYTGAEVGAVAAAGLSLVIAGGVLVLSTRRSAPSAA